VSELFTEESEAAHSLLFTFSVAMQDSLLYLSQKVTILTKPLRNIGWMLDMIGELSKPTYKAQKKIITTLEASHPFRSGSIRKFRVFEFEIPIWKNGQHLDWSSVQTALWQVVDIADRFRSEGFEALDDHLDVRLMSSSSILLSSFSSTPCSHVWGWAGIAVASSPWVEEEVWQRFMSEVVASWSRISSPEGNEILPRPHWGKEMPQYVGKEHLYGYLRIAYRNELKELEPRLASLLNNISKSNFSEALSIFGTHHHHELFDDFKR